MSSTANKNAKSVSSHLYKAAVTSYQPPLPPPPLVPDYLLHVCHARDGFQECPAYKNMFLNVTRWKIMVIHCMDWEQVRDWSNPYPLPTNDPPTVLCLGLVENFQSPQPCINTSQFNDIQFLVSSPASVSASLPPIPSAVLRLCHAG